MTLLIIVNCLPGSITEQQAYSFCQFALRTHQSCTFFFYDKGVQLGLNTLPDTTQRWSKLLHQHATEAYLCVNAVNDYAQQDKPAKGFTMAGMAQLVAACATYDKTITFAHRASLETSDDR